MNPIKIRCESGYETAINIRQHTVMADELVQDGGTDIAPTPMEIMIGTLGACIAVTTKAYAQRKGWPLKAINVEVDMRRVKREDYPTYTGDAPFIHEFREKVQFEGPLTDEQLAYLHEIAAKCPVRRVLENPVFFVEQELSGETELS